MATQWGRKETIIWPPHVPILSYTAVATAFLCTCLFIWQRLHFSLTPLQKSYITEYIRSGVGGTFNAHEIYRLALSGRRKAQATARASGRFRRRENHTSEWQESFRSRSPSWPANQGYRWFYRGPKQKLADVSLHHWLRLAVYEDERLLRALRRQPD